MLRELLNSTSKGARTKLKRFPVNIIARSPRRLNEQAITMILGMLIAKSMLKPRNCNIPHR